MIKRAITFIVIILITIIPAVCIGEEVPVMITIDEKLPDNIEGQALIELKEFLEENGFSLIPFPEKEKDNQGTLIKDFLENNNENLLKLAREEGALFLICGKLNSMETGTTKVYDTTLIQIELFGEINLISLDKNSLPITIKLKEKGLSVKLQESYQQAVGKAIESFITSIITELKPNE